ncbi:DUF3618 domain-containing protein [Rhizobium sp. YIM 134829]|uniref:DUF3618 domain-containing protein n=1 Tax=Rhizobium sp. YIM 134829 TaxID=3390453 RepID=UPI00397C5393
MTDKSSAELQQEIENDRRRIEDRIGAIQERMSPGQMVDEVLAYAKGSGGGDYLRSLGGQMKSNPIPLALMGVSLAWLMAAPNRGDSSETTSRSSTGTGSGSNEDYPLYTTQGVVRRVGPPEVSNGARYSHFTDESGRKLRALSDRSGRRAGHFVDEAGKTYRGLADATGRQVSSILDEAGSALDASLGWLTHTFESVTHSAGQTGARAGASVRQAASGVSQRSSELGSGLLDRSSGINESLMSTFREQPLIGGALAFALGAALGAVLPNTEVEDEAMGEAAEQMRSDLADRAASLADKGQDIAASVAEKAAEVATDLHDTARDRLMEEAERVRQG